MQVLKALPSIELIQNTTAPNVQVRSNIVIPAAQVKKFRFDFLKSLDPGKKKISTLEAQRIYSVLEVGLFDNNNIYINLPFSGNHQKGRNNWIV